MTPATLVTAALLAACVWTRPRAAEKAATDADGDGQAPFSAGGTDCDDEDATVYTGADEICDDGLDQDCDFAVDCEDPDCIGNSACPEICDDGVDDDGDGLVDCYDPDCDDARACVEDCDDGVDNDGDGLVDCYDRIDCDDARNCVEDCDNGVDDDGDGLADCRDRDCTDDPNCPEDCDNGADDDNDGLVDCEDGECTGDEACDDDAFRVRVRSVRGYYHLYQTSDWVCRLWFASVSGTVSDLFAGDACTFTGGVLDWDVVRSDGCSWGDDPTASSDRWYHSPVVSSACTVDPKWRKVPLSAVRRPDRSGLDSGVLRFYRRYAPDIAATAHIEVTAYSTSWTGRYNSHAHRNWGLVLTTPFTWTIPEGFPAGE